MYVGWGIVALAAVGLATVVRRRRRLLPYALLTVPALLLTYGPRADIGAFRPYRFLFRHLHLLSLQRVPERLMVVTGLLLVLLAVVALDGASTWATTPRAKRLAAALLAVAVVALVADYRVAPNRLEPSQAGNRVVTALRADRDGDRPILGIPALNPTESWNSATTYLAALSRRRTINAYNQTPAPWLSARIAALDPLASLGRPDERSLAVLRETGVRQVVVIDEPRVFAEGDWRRRVDDLVASGHFRLVTEQAPLALLEFTG
jgi:hypothetical protein